MFREKKEKEEEATVEGGNFSKILETDGSSLKMVSTEEGKNSLLFKGKPVLLFQSGRQNISFLVSPPQQKRSKKGSAAAAETKFFSDKKFLSGKWKVSHFF